MNSPEIQIPVEMPPSPIAPVPTDSTKPKLRLKERLAKLFKPVGWFLLITGALIGFTLIKIPETKVKNYIQGSIQAGLSPYGISLVAEKTSFSILFGIHYQMKGLQIFWPAPSESITHIDQIELSPSIWSFLIGKLGGSFVLKQGDGNLSGSFITEQTKQGRFITAALNANKMDFGKLNLFQPLTKIKGSLVANWDIQFNGFLEEPNTWSGVIRFDPSKIKIDSQFLQGFTIPQIQISEGTLELKIEKGKGLIQKLKLGKNGNTSDDMIGTASGDIQFQLPLLSSQLNVKTEFTLSENILKAFVLLDALLGAGKQPNGSYAFQLMGPLNSPMPTPVRP